MSANRSQYIAMPSGMHRGGGVGPIHRGRRVCSRRRCDAAALARQGKPPIYPIPPPLTAPLQPSPPYLSTPLLSPPSPDVIFLMPLQACLDQANLDDDLPCLPIYLSGACTRIATCNAQQIIAYRAQRSYRTARLHPSWARRARIMPRDVCVSCRDVCIMPRRVASCASRTGTHAHTHSYSCAL